MQTHSEPRSPGDTQVRPLSHEASLRVQEIMTETPTTVTPGTSVSEAHKLMQQHQIRHLPVLDTGRLVGMVSDRDLRSVLPSPATSLSVWEINYLLDKLTVGEVMTRSMVTVTSHCPVAEAVSQMLGGKIGALPVVEDSRVIGILTRTDVLRAFLTLQVELPDAA